MRVWGAILILAGLAGCAGQTYGPGEEKVPAAQAVAGQAGPLPPERAARNFVSVVTRMEPAMEELCLTRTQGINCDFQIAIDDTPGAPPNAFQTVDDTGRPILVFSLALIADARTADEIAFVLAHEAAHHLAGHIPQQAQSAANGAMLAGILASATGAGPEEIRQAQEIGATVGARTYSKDFELQADAIGATIAWEAGYDPVLGMAFFDRLPDPGDEFLGTHPPNAQRQAQVRRVVADLQAGRAP